VTTVSRGEESVGSLPRGASPMSMVAADALGCEGQSPASPSNAMHICIAGGGGGSCGGAK
jgi:hypothetical protein